MLFCPLQHLSCSTKVAEKDRQFWWSGGPLPFPLALQSSSISPTPISSRTALPTLPPSQNYPYPLSPLLTPAPLNTVPSFIACPFPPPQTYPPTPPVLLFQLPSLECCSTIPVLCFSLPSLHSSFLVCCLRLHLPLWQTVTPQDLLWCFPQTSSQLPIQLFPPEAPQWLGRLDQLSPSSQCRGQSSSWVASCSPLPPLQPVAVAALPLTAT